MRATIRAAQACRDREIKAGAPTVEADQAGGRKAVERENPMLLQEAQTIARRAIRPSDLCSVPMAASRTGLNVYTVWKWIRQGRIQAYGRPRCLRVNVMDLLPEYTPGQGD